MPATERHRIVFSDEKIFTVDVETSRRQWVRAGEIPMPLRKQRWCPRTHVWGMIGKGVRYITVVEGVMRAKDYQDQCLKKALPLLKRRRFQQDGARCHTASATMAFLRRHAVDVVPNWPPRSPDLSPIETVWGILSAKVAQRGPVTADELKQFVVEEFYAIPEETVEKVFEKHREILHDVIDTDGM